MPSVCTWVGSNNGRRASRSPSWLHCWGRWAADAFAVKAAIVGKAIDEQELVPLLVEAAGGVGELASSEGEDEDEDEADEVAGNMAQGLVTRMLAARVNGRRLLSAAACESIAADAAFRCCRTGALCDSSRVQKARRSEICTRLMCAVAHEQLSVAAAGSVGLSELTLGSLAASAADSLGSQRQSSDGDGAPGGVAPATPPPVVRRHRGLITTDSLRALETLPSFPVPAHLAAMVDNAVGGRDGLMRDLVYNAATKNDAIQKQIVGGALDGAKCFGVAMTSMACVGRCVPWQPADRAAPLPHTHTHTHTSTHARTHACTHTHTHA